VEKPRAIEIDYRSAELAVDGKLRGSSARSLAAAFEDLFERGFDQVVVDLRGCGSLDSLGVAAIERALALPQRLFLVLRAGLDELLPPEVASHGRLRTFRSKGEAMRAVRAREQSGVLLT
jgi:hypothetical protein